MASISFDEEVFCNHLSKFYESWKAVSLLYMPHNIYEGLLQHFAAGFNDIHVASTQLVLGRLAVLSLACFADWHQEGSPACRKCPRKSSSTSDV